MGCRKLCENGYVAPSLIRRAGLFQDGLLGDVLIDTWANVGTVSRQYV